MTKEIAIRFCVGDKNESFSPVWKFFINNSDVYLLARTMGRVWKISLHESGKCRAAMLEENHKGVDRVITKWEKTWVDNYSANVAILTPYISLKQPLNKNVEAYLSKDIYYINRPSLNEKIIIRVIFAKNDQVEIINKLPAGSVIFFKSALRNGEIVYLAYWKEVLSNEEISILKDQISKFTVHVVSNAAKYSQESILALWINGSKTELGNNSTLIVNYPLGFENLKSPSDG